MLTIHYLTWQSTSRGTCRDLIVVKLQYLSDNLFNYDSAIIPICLVLLTAAVWVWPFWLLFLRSTILLRICCCQVLQWRLFVAVYQVAYWKSCVWCSALFDVLLVSTIQESTVFLLLFLLAAIFFIIVGFRWFTVVCRYCIIVNGRVLEKLIIMKNISVNTY